MSSTNKQLHSQLQATETSYIVTFFCRDIQNTLLNSSNKHYKIIPQEIISIVLKFILNTYKWRIVDKLLIDQILNADNNTSFQSKRFKIENLDWQLEIYPNGLNAKYLGSFDVLLLLNTIPPEWKCIVVAITIYSPQTYSQFSCIHEYSEKSKCHARDWPPYTLSLSELKQLQPQEITLTVSIEILRIITKEPHAIIYQDPYQMNPTIQVNETWHIDETLMNKIKACKTPRKRIYSEVLRNMWVISLWPNSTNETNDQRECLVRTALCYLPYGVSKISA
eukprot:536343_1